MVIPLVNLDSERGSGSYIPDLQNISKLTGNYISRNSGERSVGDSYHVSAIQRSSNFLLIYRNYKMTNFKLSAKIRTALMVTTLAVASMGAANFAHADVAGHSSWVGKQKSIDGAWQIEKRNGQTVIKFSDGFQTNRGPDLKLFLSKRDISKVNGNNAADGIFLSKLKNNQGAQEYVIPGDVNIDDYASLLIHCEQFSVLWGGTNI